MTMNFCVSMGHVSMICGGVTVKRIAKMGLTNKNAVIIFLFL